MLSWVLFQRKLSYPRLVSSSLIKRSRVESGESSWFWSLISLWWHWYRYSHWYLGGVTMFKITIISFVENLFCRQLRTCKLIRERRGSELPSELHSNCQSLRPAWPYSGRSQHQRGGQWGHWSRGGAAWSSCWAGGRRCWLVSCQLLTEVKQCLVHNYIW